METCELCKKPAIKNEQTLQVSSDEFGNRQRVTHFECEMAILVGGNCPECNSQTGVKIPREGGIYCEDCGWPDEDFGEI